MAMSQKKVGQDEGDDRATAAALTRVCPLGNQPRLDGCAVATVLSILIDPPKMPPGFVEDESA